MHTQDSRLSTVGRSVRITITLVVTALVVATTFWGADDYFPFAPFKMYSTSKSLDGTAGSMYLSAVNEEGIEFRLTEHQTGFRRAELEGQISRFRADPTLLESLTEAYESKNPDKSPIVTISVVYRRYQLEGGRATGEFTETIDVFWTRGDGDA